MNIPLLNVVSLSNPYRRLLFSGLLIALLSSANAQEPQTNKQLSDPEASVVHIHNMNITDEHKALFGKRFQYFSQLVSLVLSKSCPDCKVEEVVFPPASSSRIKKYLKKGRLDIVWMHTSADREKELYPVRIPIFKGLVGWRLLLIKEASKQRFTSLATSAELQQLWAGQGHDWPDTRILQNNGFRVRTSDDWDGIVDLLTGSRIDFFPRGLNEIVTEADKLRRRGIVMDKHIALHYPTAFYLFVSRSNSKLGDMLNAGFETAVADGSFNALFLNFFADNIRFAQLESKQVFELNNNELPTATPLQRKELWFSPR